MGQVQVFREDFFYLFEVCYIHYPVLLERMMVGRVVIFVCV